MKQNPFTRILSWAICGLFLLGCVPAQALSTSASAAILMDAGSGRVLYAQNERAPLPIASITKLMTALVAADRVPNPDVLVTVDPQAVGVEGSSLYLAPNETLSLRSLLYGLLLHSGNDAAVAIAIYCAGDVDTFVAWMNEAARELGMEDTHFMNPSGLDAEGHYSSAYDMAVLAREVLSRPVLAQIVSTRTIILGDRSLANHNKLLWRYEGCIGLKTGYTDLAGRTLVSAAAREGTTLICVTLNDPNDWSDHQALLDYGFQHFQDRLLIPAGQALALLPLSGSLLPAVPVVAEREVRACLAADEQVTVHIRLPARGEAPIQAGEPLATLVFRCDGAIVGETALIAGTDAPNHRPGGLRGLLSARHAPLLLPDGLPVWQGILTRITL